jgi:pimeloyl-ACP methyl ester carboxylesterase
MREHEIEVPKGRRLGCAEFGEPTSTTVVVSNHGTGSSRLEPALFDDIYAELGLRVLAIDRPGYGNSTPVDERALVAWGDDVAAVLDQLGIGAIVAYGYSSGGPHALAMAAAPAMHDRTESVILTASIAPEQPERSTRGIEVVQRVQSSTWDEFVAWYESDIMAELSNVAPADGRRSPIRRSWRHPWSRSRRASSREVSAMQAISGPCSARGGSP